MSQFTQAIEQYCKGLDSVAIGCNGIECEYADGDENHRCESFFSWSQCDSCGSTLGGDRLDATGMWHDKSDKFVTIDMTVCIDCVMWHANGEEPETWQ